MVFLPHCRISPENPVPALPIFTPINPKRPWAKPLLADILPVREQVGVFRSNFSFLKERAMSSISSISSYGVANSYSGTFGMQRPQRPSAEEMASDLFSKLDSSGKGYIQESDLESALSAIIGSSSSSSTDTTGTASASEIFSQLDSDGDGKVTFQEAMAYNESSSSSSSASSSSSSSTTSSSSSTTSSQVTDAQVFRQLMDLLRTYDTGNDATKNTLSTLISAVA